MREFLVAAEHSLHSFVFADYGAEYCLPEIDIVGHVDFAFAAIVFVYCRSCYCRKYFAIARIEFVDAVAVLSE